jgi:predicted GH43/DUF377 family glycosyl hydrolase
MKILIQDLPMLPNLRTPHKTNRLLLAPSYQPGSFDARAVDCPFLFSHAGRYYMTFVGFDGTGYQTGLALSDDLLTWQKEGLVLGRGPAGSVTAYNAAMTCILRDNELFGSGALKPVAGRFVGTYHAYPAPGYESGPAVIGLCFSGDLRHWQVGEPVLRPADGAPWEQGGLYKSWLMEHEGTYYLFYNAKNRDVWPWVEQTGLATSTDLIHWQRCPANPLLKVGPAGAFDDLFASDPCVLRLGDGWVMFYFGNSSDGHARDSAAFSTDLLHWEKCGEVLVDVGPAGSLDARHAHKAGMIAKDGVLYHFYCAVAEDEVRGITMARGGRT